MRPPIKKRFQLATEDATTHPKEDDENGKAVLELVQDSRPKALAENEGRVHEQRWQLQPEASGKHHHRRQAAHARRQATRKVERPRHSEGSRDCSSLIPPPNSLIVFLAFQALRG